MSKGLKEAMSHQHGESQKMQAFERFREPFIVECQATKTGQPSETALDHPAPRQDHKATFGIRELNDFKPNALFGSRLTGVALVNKYHFDCLSRYVLNLLCQLPYDRAILFIGCHDMQRQQQTQGVYRHVRFAVKWCAKGADRLAPCAILSRPALHNAIH